MRQLWQDFVLTVCLLGSARLQARERGNTFVNQYGQKIITLYNLLIITGCRLRCTSSSTGLPS